MRTEIVNIIVYEKGGEKHSSVHTKLLCSVSGTFDKWFRAESLSLFKIKEHRLKTVEIFIGWLYSRKLAFDKTVDMTYFGPFECLDLIDFAYSYSCPELQNAAMDLFQDNFRDKIWSMQEDHLQQVYKQVALNSQAMWHIKNFHSALLYRQLVISEVPADEVLKLLTSVPGANKHFFVFQQNMDNEDIKNANPLERGGSATYHQCFFHDHDDSADEEACMAKAKARK